MYSIDIATNGADVKTIKRCYFSTAALATLFLLEAFLPVQLF